MSRKLKFDGKKSSNLSCHILFYERIAVSVSKCVAFYSFKNVQDWLYVERYLLQQTMRSMLFCVTQNNNNSLGNSSNTHVDHILLDQLGFHS